MKNYLHDPKAIEQKSFEIITGLLGNKKYPDGQEKIIKRVIHTTADFEYAELLQFSKNAVEIGISELTSGAHIVTDTQMACAGINKKIVGQLGGQVQCFISDPEVATRAETHGITRAMAAMDYAVEDERNRIFVIGNAPTALYRLKELIEEGKVNPALIIGVPVGFVNVVESKEAIMNLGVPHIVSTGRKGGSTVAAAIVNALLYMI